MSDKRRIEIFSAGCPVCEDAIALVKSIACSACEVEVLDMQQEAVAARAKEYGVRTVPSIVIDGMLSICCAGPGPDEVSLRANGVGVPLS